MITMFSLFWSLLTRKRAKKEKPNKKRKPHNKMNRAIKKTKNENEKKRGTMSYVMIRFPRLTRGSPFLCFFSRPHPPPLCSLPHFLSPPFLCPSSPPSNLSDAPGVRFPSATLHPRTPHAPPLHPGTHTLSPSSRPHAGPAAQTRPTVRPSTPHSTRDMQYITLFLRRWLPPWLSAARWSRGTCRRWRRRRRRRRRV